MVTTYFKVLNLNLISRLKQCQCSLEVINWTEKIADFKLNTFIIVIFRDFIHQSGKWFKKLQYHSHKVQQKLIQMTLKSFSNPPSVDKKDPYNFDMAMGSYIGGEVSILNIQKPEQQSKWQNKKRNDGVFFTWTLKCNVRAVNYLVITFDIKHKIHKY